MNPRRFLPALFLLFVGSGCAALIYEIVWFQLLQLIIGSSSISLGWTGFMNAAFGFRFVAFLAISSPCDPRPLGRFN